MSIFSRLYSEVRYRTTVVFLQAILLMVMFPIILHAQRGARQLRPNILLILSDDQRYNTIHALGGKEVITPHLDSLVRAGTTFTRAYNMGGWHGAVCVASRTMLLTGLSLWDARRSEADLNKMVATSGLWAQRLRTAGYETYMTGKWHIKADVNAVFDHVVHERPGMPNQTPQGYNRPLSPGDTAWQPWDKSLEGFWKGGKHWSEVLADDASAFLASAGGRNEPFFMYLAFNAPHDPRQAPKEFIEMYPFDRIQLPENYLDVYPFREEMDSGIDLRDEQLAPFPRTAYAVRKQIQEYYASISHMDHQIGEILQALAATGKKENTVVIFASDHGLASGHHGLMGKQNMFDHSVRVPLVLAGPGIPKDERIVHQVYLQDIMPTTLELAGVPKPAHVYFKSLLPALKKKSSVSYPEIYGAYMQEQRMVRTGEHKLIIYPQAEKILLFDLKKDPHEMRDVSDDPAYGKILEDMKTRMLRQQQQLGDTLDLSGVITQFPARQNRKTKDGWEILFDGKDLSAWRSASRDTLPPKGWLVRDGELRVLKGGTGGDIITRATYSSFELVMDFKLTHAANSGVKYLVNKIRNARSKTFSFMGPEYQVIDDLNYPDIKEDPDGESSSGSVYLLYAPENKQLHPPGAWNQLRILAKGNQVEHWLNGNRVASYERGSADFQERVAKTKFNLYPDYALADSGRILLQDHGDAVSYRNIRIRRLD